MIFYRIFSALYALLGVIFLGWGMFPIVFLFWVENFIQSIFAVLSAYTAPKAQINSADKGEKTISQVFFGKMFVNIIYFIFIMVMFGLMAFVSDRKDGFKTFTDMIKVCYGLNPVFNVAVLACFSRELWFYVHDFFIKKKYNAENPFVLGGTFGYREIIMHVSILVGGGSVLGLSKWTVENFPNNPIALFWVKFGFIIFFLLLKMSVEIYMIHNKKGD